MRAHTARFSIPATFLFLLFIIILGDVYLAALTMTEGRWYAIICVPTIMMFNLLLTDVIIDSFVALPSMNTLRVLATLNKFEAIIVLLDFVYRLINQQIVNVVFLSRPSVFSPNT